SEPASLPTTIGLLENFVPIRSSGNLVDCAVAATEFSAVSPNFITYSIDNPIPVEPAIGMAVMKNGRMTQSTTGMITCIGITISVGYRPFPAGAEMRDQIAISGVGGPFSLPGDSGALVVTLATHQPVALLFSGGMDNSLSYANRMANVMSALNIARIVGSAEAIAQISGTNAPIASATNVSASATVEH
ncbi:MAG TPA: hypothetical protein VFE58_02055, partial [Tepidisphaeraceae bacterium]|nr:hypothetical protein [Tepidisphaeraceae bacterium]